MCIQDFGGKLWESEHWADLGVNGMKNFELIFLMLDREWALFLWIRIGTGGGLL
jgi:hypothetical protein